jgi:hypothetical protein
MFEVCELAETLSTMIPLEDPALFRSNATAFALLLVPGVLKNALAGGHVPPGLIAGLAAFVRLIPIMQPLLPFVALTLARQLLVGGMGAALAAKPPMLKNIHSPDADDEPVLLISVTGEHAAPSLVEFMSRGVPTLFKTPADVKLS